MRPGFYLILAFLASIQFLLAQSGTDANNVLKISDLFNYEQEAHKNNTKEYERNLTAVRSLRQIPGDDAQSKECLQLGKKFRRLDSAIQNARSRQVELIGMINLMGENRNLLPQEVTYINHYRQKLKEIGIEQEKMQEVLKNKLRELQAFLANIPPPPSFFNNAGVKMCLLGQGNQAFYISEKPITEAVYKAIMEFVRDGQAPNIAQGEQENYQGNINIEQAEDFCRGLSKFEGFSYSIPERKELAWAERRKMVPPIAVWCRSKWIPSWEELEAQKRFAVSLFMIWDPHRVLSSSQESGLSGELKNAAYQQLGFLIITAMKTGHQLRLQRLQAELLDAE